MASPPIATIQPGQTQIVCVSLGREVDPARELAYLLFIEEAPPTLGTQDLFESFYWSIQLIGLRLGVLLVSLPLFLMAAIGGAIDGGAAWYLRRTSVGRESGFIYHRAKFALWFAMFSLWALYLVPPVALDPRHVIPPFVAIFALTVRFSVSWFKKYI